MSAIEHDRLAPPARTRHSASVSRFLLPLIRYEEVVLFVLFLLVAAFFAVAVPSARTSNTYLDLLRDVSPNLIAAIGLRCCYSPASSTSRSARCSPSLAW